MYVAAAVEALRKNERQDETQGPSTFGSSFEEFHGQGSNFKLVLKEKG
jgi:hypothetical protein